MKQGMLACTLLSSLVLLVSIVSVCPDAHAVPSFTRQTGLQCNVCHSNPPELTAFGRKFKLEGYTLTDKKADTTVEGKDLKINRYFPISVMLLLSDTATTTHVPGAQNGTAGFPQQLSLFLAGEISPHLGGIRGYPARALPHLPLSHSFSEGSLRMLLVSVPTRCGTIICMRISPCIARNMLEDRSL